MPTIAAPSPTSGPTVATVPPGLRMPRLGQLLMMQIRQQTISATTVLDAPLPIALGAAFLWKRRQVLQDLKALRAIRIRRTLS